METALGAAFRTPSTGRDLVYGHRPLFVLAALVVPAAALAAALSGWARRLAWLRWVVHVLAAGGTVAALMLVAAALVERAGQLSAACVVIALGPTSGVRIAPLGAGCTLVALNYAGACRWLEVEAAVRRPGRE